MAYYIKDTPIQEIANNTKSSSRSKSRIEQALIRGNSFKNYSMLLAVKSQSQPGSEYYHLLTKSELDKILKDGVDDSELRSLRKVFIVPKNIDYSGINDEVIRRLIISMA